MVTKEEYGAFYESYINRFNGKDILESLQSQSADFCEYISHIPEEKSTFAYQPDKWTIAAVLLHIIDTERVFSYRALSICRGEKQPLLGFDQDAYVETSNSGTRTMISLLDEFKAVRNSTICLYKNLTDEQLKNRGTANGYPISVRALGYIILGHCDHHFQILNERYLP